MTQSATVLPDKTDLLYAVLDAMPAPVFVVDEDVRIHQVNAAARRDFGVDGCADYMKRGGHALECLHATEHPDGCGCSESCGGCIVRQSARAAVDGQSVTRRHAAMQLHVGGEVRDVHLLVTAAPMDCDGRKLAMLILEDVSELMRLRSLLPICAACKKIRNDESYWEEVEQYFHARLDVDFTHGLCPSCSEHLYPHIGK